MTLRRVGTGTWIPAFVPQNSTVLVVLLLYCSIAQSATGGYDGSMLNGLNILDSYTGYFDLTPVTLGLNTGCVFIGGALGPIAAAPMTDRLGRRPAMVWGSLIAIIGIILQGAAQNIAMFAVARLILGFGSAITGIASGIYLSETCPSRWRAWMLGMLNNNYYVGALIAAGITLGTGQWQSTWAWRAPSFFQAIFSVLCLVIIPFVPESPRWLVRHGHVELAHETLALANASGDASNAVVIAELKEIMDTLEFERVNGKGISLMEIVRNKQTFRRFLIGISPGPFSCIAGNVIASYFLGQELDTAGITDTNQQLKANVVLNVWCLFCCLAGTQLASQWGRKPTALVSQGLLTVTLFIIGGLTKKIQESTTASKSLTYGDVACMFLFQGFYSIAWTPLNTLYPPEVLNYPIRANGSAFSSFSLNGLACMLSFVMPIGIDNVGWKMYVINAGWDVGTFFLILFFWVETKGLTLEEIDALFEGSAHLNVANLEDIRKGREQIDVGALKADLARVEEVPVANIENADEKV